MPASAVVRILRVVPVVLIAALVVMLFGSSAADASVRHRKIYHAVEVAVHQKGDPYGYGYAGPNRFDCSGLTMFSFDRAGLSLPRTAAEQYQAVRHIPKRAMHRGDLMFFHSGGSIYHVAVFLGRHDGHVWLLHASEPGRPVQRDPLWTSSWYGGTLRHKG
jgi:cell wall-associated NlpC family hydrolase